MSITQEQAQRIYNAVASAVKLAKFGQVPAVCLPAINMQEVFAGKPVQDIEQVTKHVCSILETIK